MNEPRPSGSAPPGGIEVLAKRELEVLQLAAEGKSNREIAVALYVSAETVRGYLKDVYRKLGVHNRTQAARLLHDTRATPSRAAMVGFLVERSNGEEPAHTEEPAEPRLSTRLEGRVLSIAGEMDLDTSEILGAALNVAIRSGEVLEVDLSGVTFMDSAGLRVLLQAHLQGPLRIVNASHRVTTVIDLVGLWEALTTE